MKWFYVIAILVTGVMVALPLTYLRAEKEGQFDGLVIGYDNHGKPIRKEKAVVLYDSFADTMRSIDPVTCGDTWSAAVQANFYEGLYSYHYLKRPADRSVIPSLAEGMPKISADLMTYTIRIRRDIQYQRNPCFGPKTNGLYPTRTVKAQDFVLAFKRCADFHIRPGLSWAFLSGRIRGLDEFRDKTEKCKATDFSRYDLEVEGIQALDDSTFQISLKEPFPQLLYVLAMNVYAPTPREAMDYWLAKADPPTAEFIQVESVVGTGPYLLHTHETKNRIVLVRNPDFREDYYPTEGAPGDKEAGLLEDAGKKVPFIDVLYYDWMPQEYPSWMTFLAKRKDASAIPRETFNFVITPGKELTEEWRNRHIYLTSAWSPAIFWIAFNMEDKVLGGSRSLRQALCLAFDVENYVKVLFNDRGRRADNVIPSMFPGHDEIGPGPYYRLDLEAAKAKLQDARKELAAKGLLDANGEIPELRMDMTRGDKAATYGDFIRQQFAKVGVRVKILYNDWSTQQEKVNNKQCQLYTMGWHADYPDPENFFQLFYSGNIDKGTNDTNYSNPAFDELYRKIRVMPEGPERMKLYVRMGRMINEDCPILLTTEPEGFAMFYDWVRNVKSHPFGYGFAKYRRIDYDLRKKLGGRN